MIVRILIRSPVFLYLLHIRWRFSGSCIFGYFSDFFFYLLFFFISIMFLSVLLEVAFYVIFRILIRSPVFLYLLHVPWRFPGICVLCPFSVSQSLSSFYLSPTCSLAFSWKLGSFFSDSHFLSYFSLYPFCSLGFF